ncbi:MAG: hypothetical protein HXY34_11520 [Candidatus Thorarchaeota archaeon]|nr:hypothetical protein [Candidatus Thorarchaeota archaeon]
MSIKSTVEVNVFSSSRQSGETSPHTDETSSETLFKAYLVLAEAKLSRTQKTVLKHSAAVLGRDSLTLTSLADIVSRKSGIPYSTVKWNLRSLVELGLITGGSSDNRGRPALLTPPAMSLVKHLR